MSNKNFGISGKGYYIALILCAAAIGISGYLYYQNANRVQEVSLQEPIAETVALGTQATQPASDPTTAARPSTAPTEAPTEPQVKKPLKTGMPVEGDTIGVYAMDCLSYNETTRDWRVHNGVDLAAEEGSEVHAAAEGTVTTVFEDASMGYTVVIRHEGGYTTRYSNLREDVCVSAGDHVALGQNLGYVGTSALIETAMDSHVHFSVTYQDAPMAPEDFFALS